MLRAAVSEKKLDGRLDCGLGDYGKRKPGTSVGGRPGKKPPMPLLSNTRSWPWRSDSPQEAALGLLAPRLRKRSSADRIAPDPDCG